MTEKRFKLIGDTNLEFLMQDKLELPIYDYDNGEKRLSLMNTLDLLNELHERNELLKLRVETKLFSRRKLEKENEQLKQFHEKVFSLFDKEIAQNEKAIEWGKEIGANSGSIGFYNHMLKKLKKELQE